MITSSTPKESARRGLAPLERSRPSAPRGPRTHPVEAQDGVDAFRVDEEERALLIRGETHGWTVGAPAHHARTENSVARIIDAGTNLLERAPRGSHHRRSHALKAKRLPEATTAGGTHALLYPAPRAPTAHSLQASLKGDRMSDVTKADVHTRIQTSFEKQGLMKLLGAELLEVERGRVVIGLRARPELSQQHGFMHAGATGAIADSAGGYAALTMFPPDAEVLSVEYKLNLLAPSAGDRAEAVAKVVRAGRTLTVCTLEVYSLKGEGPTEERKLVALGQQTLYCVQPKDDESR